MLFVTLLIFLACSSYIASAADERYVCMGCTIVVGLAQQAGLQIQLSDALKDQCGDKNGCSKGVDKAINKIVSNHKPEEVCADLGACKDDEYKSCFLFDQWPVDPLPPQPKSWPTERRSLKLDLPDMTNVDWKNVFGGLVKVANKEKDIIEDALKNKLPQFEKILKYMFSWDTNDRKMDFDIEIDRNLCGHNMTCKFNDLANGHKPLKDFDGDYYATVDYKTLRGSDWRGADCNDKAADIYPGRKMTDHPTDIDHNCNGIVGIDEATGKSYEETLCEGTGQRGLIMLGDSATAHFHIPPQWVTADGWNLNGLKDVALNEFDYPMCSWGTGHVDNINCPYQDPIPGHDANFGVISLYSKLVERNRCNTNDFQNIGVNGARMPSSMGLVDAMARNPTNDHVALVWLSLLGNDICSGHTDFDHMTSPETFYNDAMAAYNKIDTLVAPGSYVISPSLFDGELLYDTMHAEQHPIGPTYATFYDWMNCFEVNPCWGWLNTDAEVRTKSSEHAKTLNAVYEQIEKEQNFKNIKFIYYRVDWRGLFDKYTAAGLPATNLIEKVDGFHPSQAANAVFADEFFKWMETEHPEAIGEVNPNNAKIDELFFNKAKKA